MDVDGGPGHAVVTGGGTGIGLALVQELRVHPEASAWPGVLDTYLDLERARGSYPSDSPSNDA